MHPLPAAAIGGILIASAACGSAAPGPSGAWNSAALSAELRGYIEDVTRATAQPTP